MSLFIVNLSFDDLILQEEAKIGILLASGLSGLLGYFVLRNATRKPEAITEDKIRVKLSELPTPENWHLHKILKIGMRCFDTCTGLNYAIHS